MKRIILGLFLLSSCTKDEIITPQSTQEVPKVATVSYKNYNLPSYDLQTSDVTIDLMKLRRDKLGINDPWDILAVSYLDVNGDGNDDIFMICSYGKNERTSGDLFIYKNGDYFLDNSYFNERPALVHARKSIVGDFNGDKIPDIFITGHGFDQQPFPGEYTEILLSNSNKKYDLKRFDTNIGFFHGTCSGDIDKDGDLDIFVLDKYKSYFLINDGKGNFTISQSNINGNDLLFQYTCELIDVDKDGNLDLIMGGHEWEGAAKIFYGTSSGMFKDYVELPKVNNYGVITDIDSYDLDGDNVNEIVLTRAGGRMNYENFYNGWYIQVLKIDNRKGYDVTSSFIDNNSTPSGSWLIWVRFQDYDKNGKMDLFSTICGQQGFVRWELSNKKLTRVN